jgi:hypothetical protein
MEALRAGILLNERITTLIEKVNRMDQDIRHINERLIRLETLVEVTKMQQFQTEQLKIEP